MLFVLAMLGAAAGAESPNPNMARVDTTPTGPVLRFTDADFVRTDKTSFPNGGWERAPIGKAYSFESMGKTGSTKTLWVRLTFDRAALGSGPQALYAENNHERLVIYLNGREIDRTFTEGDVRAVGWYRPLLTRLPDEALMPGLNTLLIKIESNYDLVSGNFRLGSTASLESLYDSRLLWRVTGVSAANVSMVVAIIGALWFWMLRRRDVELLMMALLGMAWFARNWNFVATKAPFDMVGFKLMTYYTVYPAMSASLAFCLAFARVENWLRHAYVLAAIGVGLCIMRLVTIDLQLIADVGTDTIGNLFAVVCAAYTVFLLIRHWLRTRDGSAILMSFALLIVMAATVHDVGRLWDARWWDGMGFYMQPYLGSTFCLFMLLAFGVRAYRAFGESEAMNSILEERVETARAELQASEGKLRALEVERALECERERIMREMHDGIGSNLVAALTVAERQQQSPATIATLKRALSDLKLTVDSLDPVVGDVVALLGNFRHRADPDLAEAGIKTRWEVEECQPLQWLDATNALHILRLFQEVLANILQHSNATEIQFACRQDRMHDIDGIVATMTDNGCGFDQGNVKGQGLRMMSARAAAIGAQFRLSSEIGQGTQASLWMPYVRQYNEV
ncbi:MAG: ATP-binding protein [Sphingorhabdus sp.]